MRWLLDAEGRPRLGWRLVSYLLAFAVSGAAAGVGGHALRAIAPRWLVGLAIVVTSGLGVVNPRTDAVEESSAIRAAVEEALRFYAPERIFLNPDCGFGTFSNRPMNTWTTVAAKVGAMAAAARELRG